MTERNARCTRHSYGESKAAQGARKAHGAETLRNLPGLGPAVEVQIMADGRH